MIYTRWLYELDYRATRRLVAWGVLCVALLTYLLTLEPTASFWDCPEYVAVATGLQVGHPPGNPIFMLAARFFVVDACGAFLRQLRAGTGVPGLGGECYECRVRRPDSDAALPDD